MVAREASIHAVTEWSGGLEVPSSNLGAPIQKPARWRQRVVTAARYARFVRTKLFRRRAAEAMHGVISEAMRNGGPEFQDVATNQPTRGNVPVATTAACHLDRDAATKNPAAPRSTNNPSPTDTARS
jgi:hypothetical protein